MPIRQRASWRKRCYLLLLLIPLVSGVWAAAGGPAWFRLAETRTVLTPSAVTPRIDRVACRDVAERSGPANVKDAVAFPLKVEPGGRYLIDSADKPFLIQGDTAWSLIAQLTCEDAELYLEDRRARGFNTILVNLIEHEFSSNAPANAYGEPPFLTRGDYSTPNGAYFTHAHWVVCRAAQKGLLVLLTPSYVGYGGGDEGWYGEMVANGPDKLRGYGEYLGRTFRDCPNILWVHGGDYNVPRTDLTTAIAEGIRTTSPDALHTAHGSRNTAALDHWTDEAWLHINTIYTARPQSWSDDPVYAAALEQYTRRQRMPFFLIEGVYEGEHGADERQLRAQAYQAVLSGASGQVFGNNPIWYFSGPGLYGASMTWQEALGSRGGQSMTHLGDLLMARPWWRLDPDVHNALLTSGLGSGEDRAVAARAADGSLALLYLPSAREITIDLGELAGPSVVAQWYDPADARFTTVSGSPFPASGSHRFQPSSIENSSGFDDWVLVLESRP